MTIFVPQVHAAGAIVTFCQAALIKLGFRSPQKLPRTIIDTGSHSVGGIRYENVDFARTNYTPEWTVGLHGKAAHKYLYISYLADKKLLDAGCGERARLVRNLRADNIAAYGIDLEVDTSNADQFLFNRDITDTKFPDKHFDVVISTYSLLSYASHMNFGESSLPLFQKALDELVRVTKIGGVILLSPIYFENVSLKEIAAKNGGIEIISTSRIGAQTSVIFKRVK